MNYTKVIIPRYIIVKSPVQGPGSSDYETHKTTKKYQDAVRQAREHQEGEHRLSHKLWWAQHNYAQGEKLSDMVGDGDVNFDDLDESQ